MNLNNKQKSESVSNINKFIRKFIKNRATGIMCKVSYCKEGRCYLADTCNCCVFYNNGYEQSEIQIDWSYEKGVLKKHGLRGTYNTNFHIFELNDNILEITDEKKIITIEIEKEEQNEKGEQE